MVSLEELFEACYSLPIQKVVGAYIPVKRVGNYYEALCPFHADKHLGSFKLTPRLNIFKCFSCGEGGGSVAFVSKLFGLTYMEAAVKISRDLSLFPSEDLDYFSKKDIDKSLWRKANKKMADKYIKVEENEIADVESRDKAYRLFLKELSLNDEDFLHLKNERNLSEEEIRQGLYKTLSKDSNVCKDMFKNNKIHDKDLMGVPGFYKAKNEEGVYEWRNVASEGIVIPLFNQEKKIFALQIRKREGESRYVFFSSSFAKNRAGLISGTSAQSGYDVIYPKNPKSYTLFITEGRFKGAALSRFLNTPIITLQGVNSWKTEDLMSTIKEVEKKYFEKCKVKKFTRIVIVYD